MRFLVTQAGVAWGQVALDPCRAAARHSPPFHKEVCQPMRGLWPRGTPCLPAPLEMCLFAQKCAMKSGGGGAQGASVHTRARMHCSAGMLSGPSWAPSSSVPCRMGFMVVIAAGFQQSSVGIVYKRYAPDHRSITGGISRCIVQRRPRVAEGNHRGVRGTINQHSKINNDQTVTLECNTHVSHASLQTKRFPVPCSPRKAFIQEKDRLRVLWTGNWQSINHPRPSPNTCHPHTFSVSYCGGQIQEKHPKPPLKPHACKPTGAP